MNIVYNVSAILFRPQFDECPYFLDIGLVGQHHCKVDASKMPHECENELLKQKSTIAQCMGYYKTSHQKFAMFALLSSSMCLLFACDQIRKLHCYLLCFPFWSMLAQYLGHVVLAGIVGTIIQAPYNSLKLLQITWRSDTSLWMY